MWEKLLFGSGDRLSKAKTYWWFIWWIWDNDEKAQLAMKEDMLMILDNMFGRENLTSTVQRKNCNKAIEELGVMINPAGDLD
eukprot:11043240-Ditylum_brightwellii.AAC.1